MGGHTLQRFDNRANAHPLRNCKGGGGGALSGVRSTNTGQQWMHYLSCWCLCAAGVASLYHYNKYLYCMTRQDFRLKSCGRTTDSATPRRPSKTSSPVLRSHFRYPLFPSTHTLASRLFVFRAPSIRLFSMWSLHLQATSKGRVVLSIRHVSSRPLGKTSNGASKG